MALRPVPDVPTGPVEAFLSGAASLHRARARHPAATAGRPRPLDLARSVSTRLRADGALAPEVGAAAVATRGSWGLSRLAFAEALRLDPAAVPAIEAGLVALPHIPSPLLAADPFAALVAALRAGPVSRMVRRSG